MNNVFAFPAVISVYIFAESFVHKKHSSVYILIPTYNISQNFGICNSSEAFYIYKYVKIIPILLNYHSDNKLVDIITKYYQNKENAFLQTRSKT